MAGLKDVRFRRDDALSRIGWDRLEALLAAHYRDLGYAVDHCGTGSTGSRFDGGIDLKLRKDGQYVVVQCKHWNAKQVPHNDVHQLLGVMVNEGATGAILVTSGEFTAAAIVAAEKLGHVQLVDGHLLREMLDPLPGQEVRTPGVFDTIRLSAPRSVRESGWRVVDRASDRLLRVAEDRIRHEGRGIVGAAARSLSTFVVLKVVPAALLLLLVWFAMRTVLTLIERPYQGPPPSSAPRMQAPSTPRVEASMGGTTPAPPCRELVDAKSGTYIDHCARTGTQGPTKAELRELQRKADEAIKVLEPTTPEM